MEPSIPGAAPTPDAPSRSWIDTAPARARAYLRLARADRPVGYWLLWIPCLWGLAIAAAGAGAAPLEPSRLMSYAALMGAGAVLMRSAGCAWNDVIDARIDAEVARTATRPIPSGAVTRRGAVVFAVLLSLIGFVILLQFNRSAILIGAASVALVAAYPLMKRVTWWPQAWLGLTFNWGVLVGYAAMTRGLAAPALLAYAAGVFWTLGYDTIYAHQDREDDALIGVKSSARRLGGRTKPALALFYGAAIALFGAAGALIAAGPLYYAALLAPAAHFFWQIAGLDIDDAHDCLIRFKSNREAGLLFLLAPIAEIIA